MAAQSWLNEVRLATTGDVSLSGLAPVDEVAPVGGDRVLVKDQAKGTENGIYVVATEKWPRAVDAADSTIVLPEATVRVSEGKRNGHSQWSLANTGVVSIGKDSLTFVQSQRNSSAILTKTVDGASAAVAVGAAVALVGSNVALATAAAVAAAGGIAGIAITAGTAGGRVTVVTAGPVDPAVVSLGAGVA